MLDIELQTTAPDVTREHPEYTRKREVCRRYRDLYAGGEHFKANATQYLIPRHKEPAEIYYERLGRVFYENYAGSIIDWYAATLFRREPTLVFEGDDRGQEFFGGFVEDCDRKGTRLTDFLKQSYIDVLVGGSQKALMLPPGLAFASVSDKAWDFNKQSKLPKFYFNWAKERSMLEKNQTNFTPAISLIAGLRESLRMIKEEGLEHVYRRTDLLARATREGAKALGLSIFAKSPSPAVTAILAPEGIDGEAIYKTLWKKYGVTGAGGQDQLKGKIFRLATLGYADKYDVITAVAALEFTLRDLGYKFEMGKGVAAATESLKDT